VDLTAKGTRRLELTANRGAASVGAVLGRGPKGDPGDKGDTGANGPALPADQMAALTNSFAGKAGPAATVANTQRLLTKLYRGVEDASVLHIGTSLGNEDIEYVRLTWNAFASRFPAYTFVYHVWDATSEADWAASPVTIQTGTGSHTVHIWNGCMPGMRTDYFLGSRWQKVLDTNADLTFIEHGKNEGSSVAASDGMWRGQYLALTETLRRDLPYTGVCLILEPLNTADNDMALKNRVYESVAQQLGLGVVNVHDAFLATGNPTAYIKADGIHPTTSADAPAPNGSQLMADQLLAALKLDLGTAAIPNQRPSLLNEIGVQLLSNGNLAAWSGSAPDAWTLFGSTASKDTRAGYFESTNGYAARLQATGAAQSGMRKDITSFASLKGKWVTLAVRMRIPGGAGGTAGRIAVADGVATVTSSSALSHARDGFHWKFLPFKVSATAAYLRFYVYADTGTNASADVTIDSVHVVSGALPRIATEGVAGAPGPAGPDDLSDLGHFSTIGRKPASTLAAASASVVMNSANQAILVRIRPPRGISLAVLGWMCSVTVAGNYDIGIYDSAGNRLWSKGSTAFPAAAVFTDEAVSPAVALTSGTDYWIAFAADNTTGGCRGAIGPGATAADGFLKSMDGTKNVRVISSAFPLPATITIGTTSIYKVPAVVLREV